MAETARHKEFVFLLTHSSSSILDSKMLLSTNYIAQM